VWTTGAAGLQHSVDMIRAQLEAPGPPTPVPPRSAAEEAVAMACSSPFAIVDYAVAPAFGGNDALRVLKARANALGLRLMLDFVPNHMARDHR